MVRVKICGLTCLEDALAAVRLGAEALGFVLAPSPRRVSPEQVRAIVKALPPLVLTVGVFVDERPERIKEVKDFCGLDAVQLHGEESEEFVAALGGRVIKALKVNGPVSSWAKAYPSAALLLDAYRPGQAGGTGRTFDWKLAVELARQRPIILAGGLNPENVDRAVTAVRPHAVDVSSGVEIEPGRKDYEKLENFIRRAKAVG